MYCLYRIYRLSKETNDPQLKQLVRVGLMAYVAALTWWGLDIGFCDLFYVQWELPNIQVRWPVVLSQCVRVCMCKCLYKGV